MEEVSDDMETLRRLGRSWVYAAQQKVEEQQEEKKDKKDASKINRSIRELLYEVPLHAYIGFTASPFANLFVPPDFDELEYPSDIFYTLDELFVMHIEVEKFINTIISISARLHQ